MKSGYIVTFRGFIPIDPSDLADHAKALSAVQKAKDFIATRGVAPSGAGEPVDPGTFDELVKLVDVEKFEIKPTQRRDAAGSE